MAIDGRHNAVALATVALMTDPRKPIEAHERFVGFADILGFRSLTRSTSTQALAHLYQGTFARVAADAAAGGRSEHLLTTLNVRLFSDSVIWWTDSDRAAEFISLLQALRYLLAAGMCTGLPMRAAIHHGDLACGPLTFTSTKVLGETVVGTGLTNAYELAESQEWAGGVVADETIEKYRLLAQTVGAAAPPPNELESRGHVHRFPVPVKTSSGVAKVDHWAINWPGVLNTQVGADAIRSAFTDHGKTVDTASVRAKVDYTVDFVRVAGKLSSD